MIAGTPKADGLAISAVSAEVSGMGLTVTATVRMVDTKTGATHTSCKIGNAPNVWSKDTHDKLKELITVMEKDAAKTLLKGQPGNEEKGMEISVGDDVSGLGEYLGQESV